MPFYFKKTIDDSTQIGVWKIEEELDYFTSQIDLFEEEIIELEDLNGRKKMEWAASRYLLHLMLGESDRMPCLKDEFGKPYLSQSSLHISISHSKDLAAVIISDKSVGIDIQYFVGKIARIQQKFVSNVEQGLLTIENKLNILHCIWGAKECLYKAYGRNGVSLLDDIVISNLDYKEEGMKFKGELIKDGIHKIFTCQYFPIEDAILIYAIHND